MATRDLRFNIFANDRASAAFARISAAAEALASTITRVDGRRARVRVDADTTEAETKLARAEAKLDALNRRRSSPTIDADIEVFEKNIVVTEKLLAKLEKKKSTPRVELAIARAEANLLKFQERIEALNREKASPRVEADIVQAQADVERLRAELDYLQRNGVEIDVSVDTRGLEAKLAKLREKLTELQRNRPDIEVDANIASAERKIGQLQEELRNLSTRRYYPDIQVRIGQAQARLAELEAQLARLGQRQSSPVVTFQTALVRSQIAQVKADLVALDRVKVDPEIATRIAEAQAQIATLRAQIVELGKMRATPKIELEIAKTLAKIQLVELRLQSIKDRTISVRIRDSVNRGVGSALGYLNDLRRAFQNNINSAAQLIRNLRQLALPASFAGMLPVVASLGASFREMSGVISLLPATIGLVAAAVGTLTIGFSGLSDAIGPRDTGAQIKKADLAMSRLGETARALAGAIIDLKDDWNGLKQAVQNELFVNIVPVFRSLAERYIPVLKDGLSGMATEFNSVARQMSLFLGSADTLDQTNALFEMFAMTIDSMGPGFVNATRAFMNLAEVGASFLPILGQGFSNLMDRFNNFIETAKNDGSLRVWIAQSLTAIEEFGDLLGNIGGMFGAVFDAAQKSGTSFVETLTALTGEMENFLRSGEGQAGMIALFQGIREAIDAMMPGIRAFLSAVADAIGELQPAFGDLGAAFAAFSEALSPTIVTLASLAAFVIGPLSAAFVFLMNAIAPIAPILITIALGIKAFAAIGAVVATVGAGIAGLSTSVGLAALALGATGAAAQGAADKTTKFGNAISKASGSLPLLGAALIVVWMAYDKARSKAEEYATEVTRGAKTVSEAIAAESEQIAYRDYLWSFSLDRGTLAEKERQHAEAIRNVSGQMRDQLAAMAPLERAQAELNIAQLTYDDILAKLGPRHSETQAALSNLKSAKERLSTATMESTRLTETDTEALIRNTQEVQNAANADSAYERALLNLESQQVRTTEVLNENTASSIEGRTATLDLRDANLAVAEAAGRRAAADAEATRAGSGAEAGAKAYAAELIRLASTADGPLRDALIESIANLASTRDGSNDAAISAAGLTDAVKKVPTTQQTTFSQPGMDGAIRNMADLQGRINGLNDKTFKFRIDGSVVGIPGLATGGILPGYTPGRDVHLAALSGGEAVMRPEWTRAVGADYVYAANAVARTGGVEAVRNFVRSGGGSQDVQEYAAGGIARNAGMNVQWNWPPPTLAEWIAGVKKKALDAYKVAMAGAVGGAAGGALGGGAGGGGSAWQMSVLRKVFPGLQLISGFRPGAITATGNPSYHGKDRAVDIPARADVFNWIRGNYGGNTKELIFSPMNGAQINNGRPFGYPNPVTRSMHWDHIHWAFDKGGEAKGKGMMFKNTLKPERILDPKMTEKFNSLVETLRGSGGVDRVPYAPPIVGPNLPLVRPMQSRPQMNLGPLLRELVSLRSEVASRPQQVITQNIDGGRDPVETGHSAALAIRLARR